MEYWKCAATLCEEWLQDSEALLQKTANLYYYSLRKILRCFLRIGNLPRAGETILKTVWCLAITSWERRLLWLRLTKSWKCKYRSALETLPKELGGFPKEWQNDQQRVWKLNTQIPKEQYLNYQPCERNSHGILKSKNIQQLPRSTSRELMAFSLQSANMIFQLIKRWSKKFWDL